MAVHNIPVRGLCASGTWHSLSSKNKGVEAYEGFTLELAHKMAGALHLGLIQCFLVETSQSS